MGLSRALYHALTQLTLMPFQALIDVQFACTFDVGKYK